MITIINCGVGNFQSITNSFKYLGKEAKVSDNPQDIKKAEKIVLIGVGNFGEAVRNLKKKKLDFLIRKEILRGKPFLGICLGMQLLFERSQENPKMRGLAIFKGKCLKFKKEKVPQIGWNKVLIKRKTDVFKKIKNRSFFYFMHSFYVEPASKKLIIATTKYGKNFCSAVNLKNIFGVQFHPEKSGKSGLQILKNFIEL